MRPSDSPAGHQRKSPRRALRMNARRVMARTGALPSNERRRNGAKKRNNAKKRVPVKPPNMGPVKCIQLGIG
jgi:hypothetical protein